MLALPRRVPHAGGATVRQALATHCSSRFSVVVGATGRTSLPSAARALASGVAEGENRGGRGRRGGGDPLAWLDGFRFRKLPEVTTTAHQPRTSAHATLLKVLLRNGSQRKSAQVALRHDDPAAWNQRRLVLPSLAAHKPGQAVPNGLSLESIEEEIAAFKRTYGLHARAELPLYCVTIRELGRRGCGELADAIARKLTNTSTTPSASAGGCDTRQQRIYSALLEGYCLRRQGDEAVALYLEMVEKRNLLPSRRAIHMLIELLTRAPRQSPARWADEEDESEENGDVSRTASVASGASDEKRATTTTTARKLKVTELFEEMKARGHVTTAAYNALLSVVGRKERKLPSLKNILDEMHAHQVPRNEFTWKNLLESASGPEEFKQIKALMGEHGWKPEQSTNSVLRVLPKYASASEVMVFLHDNAHRVYAPTFNFLIKSFSHVGNFEGAFAAALAMRKAHYLPSKKAFTSFLKCGGYVLREPDVELMWSDLTHKLAQSGRKINRDYYHAKMIAHLRRKDAEAVRRTLDEMEENGVTPNNYTYYLLILVDDVDGFF